MAKGGMRDKMPVVAAWIDELRAAFGVESIDGQIRAGIRGEPVFYATENGHTVGTPIRSEGRTRIQWNARGIPYVVGDGQDGNRKQ